MVGKWGYQWDISDGSKPGAIRRLEALDQASSKPSCQMRMPGEELVRTTWDNWMKAAVSFSTELGSWAGTKALFDVVFDTF